MAGGGDARLVIGQVAAGQAATSMASLTSVLMDQLPASRAMLDIATDEIRIDRVRLQDGGDLHERSSDLDDLDRCRVSQPAAACYAHRAARDTFDHAG